MSPWTSDHYTIDPVYRDRLMACGLGSVQAVLDRVDGRAAAWSRTTDVLYVPTNSLEPGFFIKRYRYPAWRNCMRAAFRGALVGRHRGEAEFRLLQGMRSLGALAVRPVAFGARRVARFVQACFLITEETPGAKNLTSFAQDVQSGRRRLGWAGRRELLHTLARQTREMHGANCNHGQLFWRNILIRFGPVDEPEFVFLDPRPRTATRRLARRAGWWLDELSRMLASAQPFTTRAERLRFLLDYYNAPRMTPEIKQASREMAALAANWTAHETQRIKMNRLFDEWNRRLEVETEAGAVLT